MKDEENMKQVYYSQGVHTVIYGMLDLLCGDVIGIGWIFYGNCSRRFSINI